MGVFTCDSCGSGVAEYEREAAFCRGCGMVICQSCCDVFNHEGDSLHGKGDPREAVVALRQQNDEYREALKFYASADYTTDHDQLSSEADEDGGQRARESLKTQPDKTE